MDNTEETRTVRDPFLGVDAVISSRLTDRLRGKYACGPTLPNGEPEFGWRENWTPPIQHEAAARIETLESEVSTLTRERDQAREALTELQTDLSGVVDNHLDKTEAWIGRELRAKDLPTWWHKVNDILEKSRARSVLHPEEGQIDSALSAAPAPEAVDGERS